MNNLLEQQDNLQKEANLLIEKLELKSILNNIGIMSVVGSLELGLMTWRDIDIEVFVETLDRNSISEVVKQLLNKTVNRIDFTFIDNKNEYLPAMPLGLYLGIKYKITKDIVWKIDTWFVSGTHSEGFKQIAELKSKLTDEFKLIILNIKNQIADNPKYKKEVMRVDIYDAVLNHKIESMEEFNNYLKKRGKSLD